MGLVQPLSMVLYTPLHDFLKVGEKIMSKKWALLWKAEPHPTGRLYDDCFPTPTLIAQRFWGAERNGGSYNYAVSKRWCHISFLLITAIIHNGSHGIR